MDILDHVNAVWRYTRIEVAHCRKYMFHIVTAIIEYGVERAKFIEEFLKEHRIALVSQPHSNLLIFELFADWININSDDPGQRP